MVDSSNEAVDLYDVSDSEESSESYSSDSAKSGGGEDKGDDDDDDEEEEEEDVRIESWRELFRWPPREDALDHCVARDFHCRAKYRADRRDWDSAPYL